MMYVWNIYEQKVKKKKKKSYYSINLYNVLKDWISVLSADIQ